MSLEQVSQHGQSEFVAPSNDEALKELTEQEHDAPIIPIRERATSPEAQGSQMMRSQAELIARESAEKVKDAQRRYDMLQKFADEAQAGLEAAPTPNMRERAEQYYVEQNKNAENAFVRLQTLMDRSEKAQAELDALNRSVA